MTIHFFCLLLISSFVYFVFMGKVINFLLWLLALVSGVFVFVGVYFWIGILSLPVFVVLVVVIFWLVYPDLRKKR